MEVDRHGKLEESARDGAPLFAPVAVEMERRADGATFLRARSALAQYARCLGEYLSHWASVAPDRSFLIERGADGAWTGITYGETLKRVRCIAASLIDSGLSADRPIVILCDNSIEHGLLALAAMHIGVPIAPVSPAYALMSKDFGKLKSIFALLRPGLVYIADGARYASALSAVRDLHDAEIVHATRGAGFPGARSFATLLDRRDDAAVDRAHAAVTPDTIAKILFTSGSTDAPKGVINTERMLCSNQQAIAQVWPFLERTPPILVDWLPWNHTFGGNHNFNIVLRHGGTMYIDGGRPLPGLFDPTIANLRDVAPTVYFNVPRGYDMLIAALRSDAPLRRKFFSRLQLIFYAAAALPQNLWEALESLSLETLGRKLPMVSSWGLTETAPAATSCHFQAEVSGVIGVPIPGTELKLVPNSDKVEVRVRGPNVTPGYWKRDDLTAQYFDAEGYYLTGDAMRFVDPARPERGLLFDGRVAEDFKLSSGTWVSVGALRMRAISALAPIAQDIVVAGHDRDAVGFLIFPNIAACRALCPDIATDATVEQVLAAEALRRRLTEGLSALAQEGGGSSTYATCALLMAEPPSIDAGEITDKGYINQLAVLTRRSGLVERLYAAAYSPDVVRLV